MATITSTIKLVDQMTPTLNKISKAIGRINAQSKAVGSINTWSGFNTGAVRATKSTHNLYNAIRRTVFLLGTLRGLQSLANVADTMMNANARINNITNDLAKTKYYMDTIYLSAQRSRASFTDTANSVGKLATLAGSAFGGSMEQVIAFTELMNKLFVISGASAAEASNAMYQLTQAMAAGKLQGDEMRSILENAPMLAQKIADKMGVAVGKVKQLGAEGKITADIIKEALFESADEIEKKFENMPKTIGQTWTEICNHALNAFRPVIDRVQQFINSPTFERFKNRIFRIIDGIANAVIRLFNVFESPRMQNAISRVTTALGVLWDVLVDVGNIAVSVATWICDNWSWLGQIVYSVITMVLLYKAVMLAVSAAVCIANIAMGISAWISGLMAGSAWAWVILIIVALVAIIYIAVGVWNYFTDSTVSAIGVIFGAVAFLISAIVDLFVFLWDIFMSVIHILLALGRTIYQVCVDTIQFVAALIGNILTFIGLVFASALYLIYSIGTNIMLTLLWVLGCVGVFIQNFFIYLSQIPERAAIDFGKFKAWAAIAFWSILVTASDSFTRLAAGARDVAVKMLKPFGDLANGVKSIFNTIAGWWNGLCDKLSFKTSIFGQEISVDLSGHKMNKITSDWSAESWVGETGTVDILGASGKLTEAIVELINLDKKKSELASQFKDMPEYNVNWGATWEGLSSLWSNAQWFDLSAFDGSKYQDILGDLTGGLDKTWNSSQYSNPVDAFKDWYSKGEALENGVEGLVDGIGYLIDALFGQGNSNNNPGSNSLFTAMDEAGKNQALNETKLPSSLEDLLNGYDGGGGAGGIGDKLGAIKDNTGKSAGSASNIEDTLDLAEEELELLRKLAEQEVINRFTTAEIHVDMTNNNNVSSNMDLDGIVTHLSNKLYEELGVVASGVHY